MEVRKKALIEEKTLENNVLKITTPHIQLVLNIMMATV